MSIEQPIITVHDLGIQRPTHVRFVIAQLHTEFSSWVRTDGLYFFRDVETLARQADKILETARASLASLVILPELAVPESLVPRFVSWSKETGAVVIAGSHYIKLNNGYINRSPVIIGGQIFYTDKIYPSPFERSAIEGQGLASGREMKLFRNTSIGNFSVLICSDYLAEDARRLARIGDTDILCVPAFQRVATEYHARMHIDCKSSDAGLYIAFANNSCVDHADGGSAIFGVMDRIFAQQLADDGHTDLKPESKLAQLATGSGVLIGQLDIAHKKPFAGRTVNTRPNFILSSTQQDSSQADLTFARSISRFDERYSRIKEFFVAPKEYDQILSELDNNRIVFIVGDPGLGKTYTAARLLRHYFDQGYEAAWYEGLEEPDRKRQRSLLEGLKPRAKQVSYFEDPFGRTRYESRDTLRRAFASLRDHLRSVDTRIIVTSRREIFEQFLRETPSSRELAALAKELNVVKPSYSTEARERIMSSLAKSAKWWDDYECRRLASYAISSNLLATPLAIQNFVQTTERVDSARELRSRLNRQSVEQVDLFAEEIKASTPPSIAVLGVALLFGAHTQAVQAAWFNDTLFNQGVGSQRGGVAPFVDALSKQLGFRLEQFGQNANRLRFVHPLYEEALATAAAEQDPVVYDVIRGLVQAVVKRDGLRIALSALTGRIRKHYALCARLLRELAPALRETASLVDHASVADHLARICERSGEEKDIHLLHDVCPVENLVRLINSEEDLQHLAFGLRVARHVALLTEQHTNQSSGALRHRVDFDRISSLWGREPNLGRILPSLAWTAQINPGVARAYLETLVKGDGLARVMSLPTYDKYLLYGLGSMQVKLALHDALESDNAISYPYAYRQWMRSQQDDSHRLVADEGAVAAIRDGFNLLPAGVRNAVGEFVAGDVITIVDESSRTVAIGIATYSAEETNRIAGFHSSRIAEVLGHAPKKYVVSKLTLFSENR